MRKTAGDPISGTRSLTHSRNIARTKSEVQWNREYLAEGAVMPVQDRAHVFVWGKKSLSREYRANNPFYR
jgi:hypothetical protein